MSHAATRALRAAIGVCAIALAFVNTSTIEAQQAPTTAAARPNYDLASAWTS